MVTPAGPKPVPDEPRKAEPKKAKPDAAGSPSPAAQVGKAAVPKGEQEAKKAIEKKVTWRDKGIGKDIGSIWDRIAGKTKVPSEQQALREVKVAQARTARMERLEDLAGKNDPLAIDLVKECKNGKINADQAVIILGSIQQHNEKVEGIISHPLTPREKSDSYSQLFTELKKLNKNPQSQSAIDALIRKHAMK